MSLRTRPARSLARVAIVDRAAEDRATLGFAALLGVTLVSVITTLLLTGGG